MIDTPGLQLAVGAVGSAIFHSLWQGGLIVALTAVALRALHGSTSNVRYALACLSLTTLTVAWLMTAIGSANRVYGAQSAASASAGESFAADVMNSERSSVASAPFAGPLVESQERWMERLESWSRAVVPLWFIGVIGLSIRLVFGWLMVARLRRGANEPLAGEWTGRVAALMRSLRIARSVRVVRSALVHVPILIGWIRPVILLPSSALSGLTVAQLEAIIAHELAHVRRHDYLANIVQTVAEVVLFYHPACWWISKQIRAEREHCCDDIAADVCGNRVLYAEALAQLEALRSERPRLAVASTDGVLLRRIRRLVTTKPALRHWSRTWTAATVPITALLLLALNADIPAQALPADAGGVRGRVVDARSGRPVASATVEVTGPHGGATVSTDDEGRYLVSDLKPGEYRVGARAQGYVRAQYGQRDVTEIGLPLNVPAGTYTTGINLRLEAAGQVTGRVFADRGEGLAGVEVELLAERHMPDGIRPVGIGFARTEAKGEYRFNDVLPGDYYVRAYVSPSVRPSRDGDRRAYGSTFYPGVPRPEFAQLLRVSGGQELFGIDFPLVTGQTRRVTGTVIDPTSEPVLHTRVRLSAIGLNSTRTERETAVAGNGRFEIADVVPGDYHIYVFSPGSRTTRWVSTTRLITVEDDVLDLQLRAQPGARIEGRVVRDVLATRALDPSGVTVVFEHRITGGSAGLQWMGINAFGANGARSIGRDGAFSLESPGRTAVIRVSELPANWILKSVRLDGTDITDTEIDFGEGTRRVEVVLTDRVSQVRGSVSDRSGRPVPGGTVIVFADDPTRWEDASRHVRETQAGRTGQFQLTGLPAGDYLAVALADLPYNGWRNPEVLTRLRPLATRVHLEEGDERVIDLRSSTTPEELIPR